MKLLGIISIVFVLFACSSHSSKEVKDSSAVTAKGDAPYMYFKEDFHDFGKITQGEKVSYTFVLENKGKTDLVLSYVNTSCGCTATKWDQKPIPFGKTTAIEVVFNSAGKIGLQNKTITVRSNADPNNKTLTLRCEVVSPNNNSKTE